MESQTPLKDVFDFVETYSADVAKRDKESNSLTKDWLKGLVVLRDQRQHDISTDLCLFEILDNVRKDNEEQDKLLKMLAALIADKCERRLEKRRLISSRHYNNKYKKKLKDLKLNSEDPEFIDSPAWHEPEPAVIDEPYEPEQVLPYV
jgi:hypothetical protein